MLSMPQNRRSDDINVADRMMGPHGRRRHQVSQPLVSTPTSDKEVPEALFLESILLPSQTDQLGCEGFVLVSPKTALGVAGLMKRNMKHKNQENQEHGQPHPRFALKPRSSILPKRKVRQDICHKIVPQTQKSLKLDCPATISPLLASFATSSLQKEKTTRPLETNQDAAPEGSEFRTKVHQRGKANNGWNDSAPRLNLKRRRLTATDTEAVFLTKDGGYECPLDTLPSIPFLKLL